MKHAPREYLYVAAWGRMIRKANYFIRQDQELASAENAPLDAVYRERVTINPTTYRWFCKSDCSLATQRMLDYELAFIKRLVALGGHE